MQENNPPGGTRETVISAVRIAMAGQKMSGRALSECIGMPQSAFSRRMTGEVAFTIDELAAVSAALECTLAELVGAIAPTEVGAA